MDAQSFRKYLGSIKDTTTVSLAKVNSDYKELDVAIVKATSHIERPAKEKYIAEIFLAISASRPRADVAYCIHALARRLAKTRNWAVALKTLIVIHRALREVDSTFREELINYGRNRCHMLNMAHFKDDSSPQAWDYSAWVRNYALFLEERLECFRILKYDIETEPSRTRELNTVDLLDQLPALQQLLFRLLSCQPQGAASYNTIIQHALLMVALESVKIYTSVSDGTINLVDKFFEMQRNDAVRALDIYKRATQQAEALSQFYEVCKTVHVGRGEKFLKIEQPPASFLQNMEEYVREAPRSSTVNKDEKVVIPKIALAIEYKKMPEIEEAAPPPPPPPPPTTAETVKEEEPEPEPSDLLGLNDANADTSEIDQKNALALAIVPIDDDASTRASSAAATGFQDTTTGWELALVTAPSSNESAVTSSKLAGGLDKLTLDSLYDDAHRRANQTTSYNPWETAPLAGSFFQPSNDPFYASNSVAAPHSVQMAAMAQQQHSFLQQQMMMSGHQLHPAPIAANPFGNPYVHPTPSAASSYGPTGMPGMPVHHAGTYTGLI